MVRKTKDQEEKEKLKKLIKIILLIKNLIKNFSEAKLKKVILIKEIRWMLLDFINKINNNEVTISGLLTNSQEMDKKIYNTLRSNIFTLVSQRFQGEIDKED